MDSAVITVLIQVLGALFMAVITTIGAVLVARLGKVQRDMADVKTQVVDVKTQVVDVQDQVAVVDRGVTGVHDLVNSKSTEQKQEIASLAARLAEATNLPADIARAATSADESARSVATGEDAERLKEAREKPL